MIASLYSSVLLVAVTGSLDDETIAASVCSEVKALCVMIIPRVLPSTETINKNSNKQEPKHEQIKV